MDLKSANNIDIPWSLLEGLKGFPLTREVEHCGVTYRVSSFDIYAPCPSCGARLKVRACSGVTEIEDVFDAVFSWMNQPEAEEVVRRRRKEIAEDDE